MNYSCSKQTSCHNCKHTNPRSEDCFRCSTTPVAVVSLRSDLESGEESDNEDKLCIVEDLESTLEQAATQLPLTTTANLSAIKEVELLVSIPVQWENAQNGRLLC